MHCAQKVGCMEVGGGGPTGEGLGGGRAAGRPTPGQEGGRKTLVGETAIHFSCENRLWGLFAKRPSLTRPGPFPISLEIGTGVLYIWGRRCWDAVFSVL